MFREIFDLLIDTLIDLKSILEFFIEDVLEVIKRKMK